MFSRILFVLFAIVALQHASANVVAEQDLQAMRGISIWDQVRKAIDYLKSIVDGILQSAINQFERIFQKLVQFAEDIVDEIIFQINEITHGALGDLDELVDKAAQAGVDVAHCIVGKEERLTEIPIELTKDLTYCVETKLNEAKNIIKNTVEDIMDSLNIIDDLEEQAEKCGKGVTSVACLTKLLAEITLQIAQLPIKLTADITKAVSDIAKMEAELVTCTADALAAAVDEIGQLLVDTTTCVEDAIDQIEIAQPLKVGN